MGFCTRKLQETLAGRWTVHGGFLQQNNLPFPRLQRLLLGSQSAAVGELNQLMRQGA